MIGSAFWPVLVLCITSLRTSLSCLDTWSDRCSLACPSIDNRSSLRAHPDLMVDAMVFKLYSVGHLMPNVACRFCFGTEIWPKLLSLKPHGALHKTGRHTTNRPPVPRISFESTVHLALIITLAYSVIYSAMEDGTHPRMYLGHQIERANPTPNETLYPQVSHILDDKWENAWQPHIPTPIHSPRVSVRLVA